METAIDNLYKKMVEEYNRNHWEKICSLGRFLKLKAEIALDNGNGYLYNDMLDVIQIAENDY